MNDMKVADICDSINEEIQYFNYRYNKMPSCIFMSWSLYEYIREELTYNSDTFLSLYHGIEVKFYGAPEPQYYLAEGPGRFKVYKENDYE